MTAPPDQSTTESAPTTVLKPTTVLVLGGAGFIGRHTLAALSAITEKPVNIIIASRTPEQIDQRIPEVAQHWPRVRICMESMLSIDCWHESLKGVDVVLNCVGILRQRGASTYARVHHEAPACLASACAASSIRMVHISALGLHDNAGSRFLTSKLRGEHAIENSGADWIIARPSLIDGPDGFGARWLRKVAQLPVFVTPVDAHGHIAAIHIGDLAQALANLCVRDADQLGLEQSREFELGGMQTYTFHGYIVALRRTYTDRPARAFKIPSLLARLGAHLCDFVHFSPFSYGHWELLHRDNIPQPNRLQELLDTIPMAVPVTQVQSHDTL